MESFETITVLLNPSFEIVQQNLEQWGVNRKQKYTYQAYHLFWGKEPISQISCQIRL